MKDLFSESVELLLPEEIAITGNILRNPVKQLQAVMHKITAEANQQFWGMD